MKTIHLSLIALLMLASCHSNESKSADTNIAYEESPIVMNETVQFSPPTDAKDQSGAGNFEVASLSKSKNTEQQKIKIPEKIKKTANLSFTVDDYLKARTEIEKLVKSGNGYIANDNEQKNTYSINNNLIIRVVNKDFENLINNLLKVASDVNSKNILVEDVTAEFVDIQARLNSKKAIEARYIALLGKAQKVSDMLEIEEKLGEIREEIEAKEGELKYLSDQVDYSTINLYVHQDFEYIPSENPGFWGRMGNAFGNGWNGFLTFIVGLMYAWPLWIILGIGTFILVRFIKKRLKK